MSDYIRRKDVIAALNGLLQDIIESTIGNGEDAFKDGIRYGEKACAIEAILRIKALPAADVAQRKKGKWVYDPKASWKFECPYCETFCPGSWNFCPNCGADMRGEGRNE